jgi:hypothetical protein
VLAGANCQILRSVQRTPVIGGLFHVALMISKVQNDARLLQKNNKKEEKRQKENIQQPVFANGHPLDY